MKNLTQLVSEMSGIILNAKEIDTEESWELTYNLIFNKNMSSAIYKHFDDLSIDFKYYDPDTSYKEDVTAFYDAVVEKVDLLKNLTRSRTPSV